MYAVIDIGSNTVKMVIYTTEKGRIKNVLSSKVSCALASYSEKRVLSDEGADVLIETLKGFKKSIDALAIEKCLPFATASLRYLKNKNEILKRVKKETGLDVNVISGEDEAMYDYYGVLASTKGKDGILSDIGGASTELAVYTKGGIRNVNTMPIGALSAYRDFVKGVFPTEEEMAAITKEVYKNVDALPIGIPEGKGAICAIGGTARATLKVANRTLNANDMSRNYVTAGEYKRLFEIYKNDETAFIKRALQIAPERVHTLIPGMCIQLALLEKTGRKRINVTSSGVREGYLYSHLAELGLE